MNIAAIRSEIYVWASQEAAPAIVVWADQAAPRPPRPYVTLRLTGPRRVSGHDEARYTGSGEIFDHVGHRELTLEVQAIAEDQIQAHDLAIKLNNSLSRVGVSAALYSVGVSISDEGDVKNITIMQDTTYESRYAFDATLLTVAQISEDLGAIETVELNGEEVAL